MSVFLRDVDPKLCLEAGISAQNNADWDCHSEAGILGIISLLTGNLVAFEEDRSSQLRFKSYDEYQAVQWCDPTCRAKEKLATEDWQQRGECACVGECGVSIELTPTVQYKHETPADEVLPFTYAVLLRLERKSGYFILLPRAVHCDPDGSCCHKRYQDLDGVWDLVSCNKLLPPKKGFRFKPQSFYLHALYQGESAVVAKPCSLCGQTYVWLQRALYEYTGTSITLGNLLERVLQAMQEHAALLDKGLEPEIPDPFADPIGWYRKPSVLSEQDIADWQKEMDAAMDRAPPLPLQGVSQEPFVCRVPDVSVWQLLQHNSKRRFSFVTFGVLQLMGSGTMPCRMLLNSWAVDVAPDAVAACLRSGATDAACHPLSTMILHTETTQQTYLITFTGARAAHRSALDSALQHMQQLLCEALVLNTFSKPGGINRDWITPVLAHLRRAAVLRQQHAGMCCRPPRALSQNGAVCCDC